MLKTNNSCKSSFKNTIKPETAMNEKTEMILLKNKQLVMIHYQQNWFDKKFKKFFHFKLKCLHDSIKNYENEIIFCNFNKYKNCYNFINFYW